MNLNGFHPEHFDMRFDGLKTDDFKHA